MHQSRNVCRNRVPDIHLQKALMVQMWLAQHTFTVFVPMQILLLIGPLSIQ